MRRSSVGRPGTPARKLRPSPPGIRPSAEGRGAIHRWSEPPPCQLVPVFSGARVEPPRTTKRRGVRGSPTIAFRHGFVREPVFPEDRKSTRLNSSHRTISYAVFCLKKKNKKKE